MSSPISGSQSSSYLEAKFLEIRSMVAKPSPDNYKKAVEVFQSVQASFFSADEFAYFNKVTGDCLETVKIALQKRVSRKPSNSNVGFSGSPHAVSRPIPIRRNTL